MAYFRKLRLFDDSNVLIDEFESNSLTEFFVAWTTAVEAFVSGSYSPLKFVEYWGAATAEESDRSLFEVFFTLGGSYADILTGILTNPDFNFSDNPELFDPWNVIRSGTAEQKKTWFRQLWKDQNYRDVFRIVHRGE
jgi:hypothetical protein